MECGLESQGLHTNLTVVSKSGSVYGVTHAGKGHVSCVQIKVENDCVF